MRVTTTQRLSYKDDTKVVDVFEGVGEVAFAQDMKVSIVNAGQWSILILNRDTYDSVLIEADPS